MQPLSDHGPELSPAEQVRTRQLVVTRRRATGLLVVVAVVFAVSTVLVHRAHWLAWVQAAAVASLVGGLADWFAVTALFRRPLGLPIPHTAIVVERKDRFAQTLGSFVQESFLSPDAVVARLHSARALPRLAAWLSDETNARMVAARAATALSDSAGWLRDGDAAEVIDSVLRRRLEKLELAPLAGRALEHLTRDGRHEPVLDDALNGLARYLAEHGPEMHRRLGMQSPWWLPGSVSNRMVLRLLDRSGQVLSEMAADRNHPLRLQLGEAVSELAGQLQHDPVLRARGEELKAEFLEQQTVRDLASTLWADFRHELSDQSEHSDSELRSRLAALVSDTGRRLGSDARLASAVSRTAEAALRSVLTGFSDELVALVTATIDRWDAADTSRRLELLLGPDLQYIRINGTVVGALAGLALHAVTVAVG